MTLFNAYEDAMPKDNADLFGSVLDKPLKPPQSGLGSDPEAKNQTSRNGYTTAISAAGKGAL